MNRDEIDGKTESVKGKIKQAVGDLTDNQDLHDEGGGGRPPQKSGSAGRGGRGGGGGKDAGHDRSCQAKGGGDERGHRKRKKEGGPRPPRAGAWAFGVGAAGPRRCGGVPPRRSP